LDNKTHLLCFLLSFCLPLIYAVFFQKSSKNVANFSTFRDLIVTAISENKRKNICSSKVRIVPIFLCLVFDQSSEFLLIPLRQVRLEPFVGRMDMLDLWATFVRGVSHINLFGIRRSKLTKRLKGFQLGIWF